MFNASELIKKILSGAKLSDEKIYSDEPIIFTASKMKNYTPPEYTKMKKLITARELIYSPANEIFYKQGKFMENFEDDCEYSVDFIRYFPTYSVMSTAQLRGYFTWRAKIRKGIFEKTAVPFAFMYIYELLNNIGVASSESGFYQLKEFAGKYGALDSRITPYTCRWLIDYAAYYGLDSSVLNDTAQLERDSAVICLKKYREHTPHEVLSSLNSLSSYKILNSALYKKHPDAVAETVYGLYSLLDGYYLKRGKDIADALLGKSVDEPYLIFRSAVFYEQKPHKDCEYIINDIFSYTCKGNSWRCVRFFPVKDKAGRLGAILKNTDFCLRQTLGLKSSLKKAETSKAFETLINNAVNDYTEKKRQRERRVVNIDFSKLSGIRSAAELTREKLIVDESEEETENVTEQTAAPPPDDDGTNIPYPEILKALLTGGNAETAARECGVMLSVAVDEINEALFEELGDTALVYEDDSPCVLEDYTDELKGMLKI